MDLNNNQRQEEDAQQLDAILNATPMERQYKEIKSRHRDKILLFRLGDFYEMFYEDAKTASQILSLTLTARRDMPMCGFPYHAAQGYIRRLMEAGKKVAVCEQMEDPAKAKGLVKRGIVSIVTPGTVTDDNLILRAQNNFLACVFFGNPGLAVTFADVSTGECFAIKALPQETYRTLQDELARFSPSEIIYNEECVSDRLILKELEQTGALIQSYPQWYFKDYQSEDTYTQSIAIDEALSKDEIANQSVRGAINYLMETQLSHIRNIREVRLLNHALFVEIDDFTLRNLELLKNMQDGSKKFTLLEALDETVTPMGGRLLRRWIVMPLFEPRAIYRRQNTVEAFYDDSILLSRTREKLKEIGDIERLTSRIALKKAIPRDASALAVSLTASLELKAILLQTEAFSEIVAGIADVSGAIYTIRKAVLSEPSNTFGGDVIRPGYSAELDKLRELLRNGKDWIVALQNRERERTGIGSLKVKYNKVFGYFIEISKSNLTNVPDDYLRKQSLVNAERYTLPELSEYESQILSAGEKVESLEEELFNELIEKLSSWIPDFQSVAGAVGEADVTANFAKIARERLYVKPVVDDGDEIAILGGRHPVVEQSIGSNLFVPNDAALDNDENRILIITGPNMAGKSTYLRQNALIVLMAQMGSYVPAKSARIGLVDKVFTRIGASDQLSAGRSTFMVEMEEASNILRNATDRSLIIMDELGRGTSTYDGLSIAWAVVEYLLENKARSAKTLFATHYHELTQLGERRGIRNFNIAVKEYQDELIFLRKVVEGPADKSYGIYVAKLAGLPNEIIERARIILSGLENSGNQARERIDRKLDAGYRAKKRTDQMELFPDDRNEGVIERIRNLDLERITPLEAMAFLGEIRRELK